MDSLKIAKRTKKGKKGQVKDKDLEELNIRYHDFHPEWNYTISPRTKKQGNKR